jgi:alpha-glucosidase (family GH31 glycosyl hydrolase)
MKKPIAARWALFFISLCVWASLRAQVEQAALPGHAAIGGHAGVRPTVSCSWGVGTATVGPVSGAGALEDGGASVLTLERFYRIGGENIPSTPSECRLAYDKDSLFVFFRCGEPDSAYPAIRQPGDWYRLEATPVEQDAVFPDKVEVFIRPDGDGPVCYHFAVTRDGQSFGMRETLDRSGDSPRQAEKTGDFRGTVRVRAREWTVLIGIPWAAIGGRPKGYFGIVPLRTRWRTQEVSSPVALGFEDRRPDDLYMETTLGPHPEIHGTTGILDTLVSGVVRWQRPARLDYPAPDILRQIWALQQALAGPTTGSGNLAPRIALTQQWTDLLQLEGFNFGATTGSIVPEDLFPDVLRRRVNGALRKRETGKACGMLDTYLHRLDTVSRRWFADHSPGDIRQDGWSPVDKALGLEVKDSTLAVRCMAGGHVIVFHLAFPATGGVRLWAGEKGFFNPVTRLPLTVQKGEGYWLIPYANGKISISRAPFRMAFITAKGDTLVRIGGGNIAFRFEPGGRVSAVDFRQPLGKEEAIYGFGEKSDAFDQRGKVLTLWGMDDWKGNTEGLANESYKPVPLFHSSRGYMIFVNSSYRLRADIGKTAPGSYRITQQGPLFDYYLWCCPPEEALISYTSLTGKPFLPPRWAFEPWMGRTGRGWAANPAHDPVAEQERVINRFRQLDIPHSAIYAEGNAADNPALYAFLAPTGMRALSWYFSSVSRQEQQRLMGREAVPLLAFADTAGTIAHSIDYIDFTHPNALALARRWWQHRLDLGLSGSMVDFGDRVPEDARFYNGRKGDELHNFYGYYYHKAYSTIFRERRGDDFILFARSAAPGDQQWIGQFAGDHSANFKGLREVLNGLLTLSACGFSTWGSDLGGFRAWPDPAVYMRWTQFACFSPLMRSHGRTPREPWEYGTDALANYKRFAWVRENLLDYIYGEAAYTHATGIPLVRSMAVAFPGLPPLAQVDDQYMFGRDLLVAPVITEDADRPVFFPPGKWYSLWNGAVEQGGDICRVQTPLSSIPVYMREGAILPVAFDHTLQWGQSMTGDQVHAFILTPAAPFSATQRTYAGPFGGKVSMRAEENGLSVILDDLLHTLYLILYMPVSAVSVNGRALPALDEAGRRVLPPGWYRDEAQHRTIVRLPSDVHRVVTVTY